MDFVEITPKTIKDFRDFIPADEDENIGRSSYRALGAKDKKGSPRGVLIWEYKRNEDNEYYASEIVSLNASTEKTGKELLSEYDRIISEYKLENSYYEFEEISKANSKLLKAAGFEEAEGAGSCINITVGELAGLKLGGRRAQDNVVMVKDIEETELRQGLINSMFIGMRGLIEDIDTVPLSWFDREVSSCSLADGRVEGMFLIHKRTDGTLMPVLFMSSVPDGKGARLSLLGMLRRSAEEMQKRYPPETPIKIKFLREQTKEFVKKLFPDKTGNKIIIGIREEK